MNIHHSLWEHWLEIFKYNVDKKEKINKYVTFFSSVEIDTSYIQTIINDNHLIDFFSSGYEGVYKNIDDIYRLYSNNIPANLSTQIIKLKFNLSTLLKNMEAFKMLNLAVQEFKVKIETGHMNEFKENVKNTVITIKKLLSFL